MKTIFFLLLANAALSQEAELRTSTKTPTHQTASVASSMDGKSMIIIDPKARSSDSVQAFHLLRKEKPALKIMLRTKTGIISNVTDLSAFQNGTLYLVRVLGPMGAKIQIIPVEELMEIDYLPQ